MVFNIRPGLTVFPGGYIACSLVTKPSTIAGSLTHQDLSIYGIFKSALILHSYKLSLAQLDVSSICGIIESVIIFDPVKWLILRK